MMLLDLYSPCPTLARARDTPDVVGEVVRIPDTQVYHSQELVAELTEVLSTSHRT